MPGKYQPDKANIFSKNIYFFPSISSRFEEKIKKLFLFEIENAEFQ